MTDKELFFKVLPYIDVEGIMFGYDYIKIDTICTPDNFAYFKPKSTFGTQEHADEAEKEYEEIDNIFPFYSEKEFILYHEELNHKSAIYCYGQLFDMDAYLRNSKRGMDIEINDKGIIDLICHSKNQGWDIKVSLGVCSKKLPIDNNHDCLHVFSGTKV